MTAGHWDVLRAELTDTLFIKDGPLTLRGQYSKLVPPIRDFLQFAKDLDSGEKPRCSRRRLNSDSAHEVPPA